MFQEPINVAFDEFGVQVTYIDQDADTKKVKVIPRQPDQQIGDFTDTTIHTTTTTFQVRASDIKKPVAGDKIEYDGQTFRIQGEPRRDDPRRLVWTLDTRPV